MKTFRRITILSIALSILTVSLCSCRIKENPRTETYTYVLTTHQCGALFWVEPTKYVSDEEATFPYSEVVSESLDVNGNLVLVLTSEQVALWKEHFEKKLEESINKINETEEEEVILSDDFTKIVYKTNKESCMTFVIRYTFIMNYSGILTLLEKGTVDEWKCETTLQDISTGKIVWNGFWPEETPEFEQEDFE